LILIVHQTDPPGTWPPYGDFGLKLRRIQYMHSNKTMIMDIPSITWQIVRTVKFWLMNSICGFFALLSIWTETKTDVDTLKIRKKGVN